MQHNLYTSVIILLESDVIFWGQIIPKIESILPYLILIK